jgi:hypothetical protein
MGVTPGKPGDLSTPFAGHAEGKTSATEISVLTGLLQKNASLLSTKKVTAGFDGFIDTIVKVIKSKEPRTPPSLFNSTIEFGNYIVEKGGTSFALEVEERNIKVGGNMPIMANALGMFGAQVHCVGALGYPQIHPVFKAMSPNCNLLSFANPGTSTAFEFNDGKIMFGNMGDLNTLGWTRIKDTIGADKLVDLYESSDLLCVVNWSEIDVSSDIWKGLLAEVFPRYTTKKSNKDQIMFFDLSDCSKRSPEAIEEAMLLIREFSEYARVILSLNRNETRCIHSVLFKDAVAKELKDMGKAIFEALGIETLLLHSPKDAIAINSLSTFRADTFFVPDPKLSTGAGDHFNAGFATARLMQLDARASLIFANAVAAYYVKTGASPVLQDVVGFLNGHR